MPKRLRCHKCRCCHHLYEPDPRSRYHQTYCSKPDCQKASKTASQRKWRRSDKGRDYFRGPANAHRVQVWRKAHPGYARKRAKPSRALQDGLSPQTLVPPADTPTLNPQSSTDPRALQETMSVQSLLLTSECSARNDCGKSPRSSVGSTIAWSVTDTSAGAQPTPWRCTCSWSPSAMGRG